MPSMLSLAFCRFETVIQRLLMTWTPYYDLLNEAREPAEYEEILHRMTNELKFHCETLLSILFFIGTQGSGSPVIAWTLGCLLFNFLTYVSLDAMTGKSLKTHMDDVAGGKLMLACLSKLPSTGVVLTLVMLATRNWKSVLTIGVLCLMALVLLLKIMRTLWLLAVPKHSLENCTAFFGRAVSCFRPRKTETKSMEQNMPVPVHEPGSPDICV